MAEQRSLKGVRVFVVEDETLLALLLEDMLVDMGCEVLDMAWRLAQAIKVAETSEADVAILDVNIAGERVDPVADILEKRKIPFVFATGYGVAGLPDRLRGHPVLPKPVSATQLATALGKVLNGASGP
ncbi:response regulator [Mesorhizobium sp. NBSH29]|uniref:response regulator n=1 Tax=Mesorhizobium sp. NBSH29 TaxID=2654249 RepID=UPI00189694DD|nr:response regulator [Mesorhizobium sp. NBSH29]QPC86960.1 response regulator [Mesorhizobium sp. NBSH29]